MFLTTTAVKSLRITSRASFLVAGLSYWDLDLTTCYENKVWMDSPQIYKNMFHFFQFQGEKNKFSSSHPLFYKYFPL